MPYDPTRHHRRSIRLEGFDYSSAGAYFVTVCVQSRRCLFGDVMDGEMRLNPAGEMLWKWWSELGGKFPTSKPDEFVVMPNHIHGIVFFNYAVDVGTDLRVGPLDPTVDVTGGAGAHVGAPLQSKLPSLGTVLQWYKTMTTNEYIRGVKTLGWPGFDKRWWQRNYYERIIRDEDELQATRPYIHHNPAHWDSDEENPLTPR